jgi:DNA-binding MarR family transcriptional regulator
MTTKQKLILFLISCNPGIRDIYTMIKIFDRADFPSKMGENLEQLLDNNLIYVTHNFDNGTPNRYAVTDNGKAYLDNNFNETETIEYIKKLDNPDFLLQLTQTYIDKKNGL